MEFRFPKRFQVRRPLLKIYTEICQGYTLAHVVTLFCSKRALDLKLKLEVRQLITVATH